MSKTLSIFEDAMTMKGTKEHCKCLMAHCGLVTTNKGSVTQHLVRKHHLDRSVIKVNVHWQISDEPLTNPNRCGSKRKRRKPKARKFRRTQTQAQAAPLKQTSIDYSPVEKGIWYGKMLREQERLMFKDSVKFYLLVTVCSVSLLINVFTWIMLIRSWLQYN